MDLLLFGPPGAGKGTQARLVSKLLGIPHISTGDMMRQERESGSELGNQFDAYMKDGKLVPDELVIALLKQRLEQDDATGGAIFDGFPRTLPQAEALDALLTSMGRTVGKVVFLDVPLDNILDRITGRRVCLNCGHVYHLRYNPPPSSGICVDCGQKRITARKDDSAEVAKKRYEQYHEQTSPLLRWYEERGILASIDGTKSQDEVTASIQEVTV